VSAAPAPAGLIPDPATVQAGYEHLRAQALAGARGAGWALVVRCGVGAWLAACAAGPVPPPHPVGMASPAASRLPPGLQAEVVVLLAGMVLPVGREARA
jgi:hypothetical protein